MENSYKNTIRIKSPICKFALRWFILISSHPLFWHNIKGICFKWQTMWAVVGDFNSNLLRNVIRTDFWYTITALSILVQWNVKPSRIYISDVCHCVMQFQGENLPRVRPPIVGLMKRDLLWHIIVNGRSCYGKLKELQLFDVKVNK